MPNITIRNNIDYAVEYDSLAGQKWIVVQRKLHQLDDFVSKWEGVLEPFTSVTLVIKRELDKYSVRRLAGDYRQVHVPI